MVDWLNDPRLKLSLNPLWALKIRHNKKRQRWNTHTTVSVTICFCTFTSLSGLKSTLASLHLPYTEHGLSSYKTEDSFHINSMKHCMMSRQPIKMPFNRQIQLWLSFYNTVTNRIPRAQNLLFSKLPLFGRCKQHAVRSLSYLDEVNCTWLIQISSVDSIMSQYNVFLIDNYT